MNVTVTFKHVLTGERRDVDVSWADAYMEGLRLAGYGDSVPEVRRMGAVELAGEDLPGSRYDWDIVSASGCD